MPSTPVAAAAEGLPKDRPAPEQIVDTMSELEGEICDLELMAEIVSDLACEWLNRQKTELDGRIVFHVSKLQREKLLFTIFDVKGRIASIKESYMEALYGKEHAQ